MQVWTAATGAPALLVTTTDFVGITAATMRYAIWRIPAIAWASKVMKSRTVANDCANSSSRLG